MMQTPGGLDPGRKGEDEVSGHPLISASKVQGTAVFDTEGGRLGHVEDVMLHKVSGQVAYAIISFGGLLGIGERFTPLPWSVLTYDTGRNGYVIPLGKEQLQAAPHYDRSELANDHGGWGRHVNEFYQVTPSWG